MIEYKEYQKPNAVKGARQTLICPQAPPPHTHRHTHTCADQIFAKQYIADLGRYSPLPPLPVFPKDDPGKISSKRAENCVLRYNSAK